jgi:hypothetical protein
MAFKLLSTRVDIEPDPLRDLPISVGDTVGEY